MHKVLLDSCPAQAGWCTTGPGAAGVGAVVWQAWMRKQRPSRARLRLDVDLDLGVKAA